MMTFVKRLFLVPIGFVAGVIVAAAVVITLGSEQVTHAMAGRMDVTISDSVGLVRQVVKLVSVMTLVPAILMVIVGEVARIRTVYYYVLAGGAALCTIPAMAWIGEAGAAGSPPAIIWQVFATAGFLGGFVYWMIAGRSS